MPTCETDDEDRAKSQIPTTPRRSPAVRYPRNGATNEKAAKAKAATQRNAPVRGKTGGKKSQPTLLGDFLLGRPSVDRVRRRSSGVAHVEVKASTVGKLQPPGGVKERVKQWQKTSAAAVIEDSAAPAKSSNGDISNVDEMSKAQLDIESPPITKPEKKKGPSPLPPRARGTPRKRVVSDSHWVKNKKKSPPRKPDPLLNLLVDPNTIKKGLMAKADGPKRLPKDFVKSNWANPPLERKIQDWVERTDESNAVPCGGTPEEVIALIPGSNLNSSVMKAEPPAKVDKSKGLPKKFLKSNWANPPLERKIQDWAERTDKLTSIPNEKKLEAAPCLVSNLAQKPTNLKKGPVAKISRPKGLPKDFVESHWANPPLALKMQDWAERIDKIDTVPSEEVTDLLPSLPEDPNAIKNKPTRGANSLNCLPKNSVDFNLVNPPLERKIQDWVERVENPEVDQQEERRTITAKKTSEHVEDRKSSGVQKCLGDIETLVTADRNYVGECPLSQPTVRNIADSEANKRCMPQNQAKEKKLGKVHADSQIRSENKSAIGRRGAIHKVARITPKKCDLLNDQDAMNQSAYPSGLLQSPVNRDRRLTKQEIARKQDRLANNKDPTRSRDLRTLAPMKGVEVDQTRQVKAKEYFDLDLQHTNGQRMACEIELIVRDSDHDAGDILICEVDARRSHCLLFQPLTPNQISVRQGDLDDDLIVMVRGQHDTVEWSECFILKAEHPDIVEEFLSMFSRDPMPPAISRFDPQALGRSSLDNTMMSGALICPDALDVPIGEHAGFRDEIQQPDSQTQKPLATIDDHSSSQVRTENRISLSPAQNERTCLPHPPHTTEITNRIPLKELSISSKTRVYPDQASDEKGEDYKSLRLSSSQPLDIDSELTPTPLRLALNIEPPPPPPHKCDVSNNITTDLRAPRTPNRDIKHRRSSSPLKHEYHPSHDSSSSASSYLSDTDDEDPTFEISGESKIEPEDIATQLRQVDETAIPDIGLQSTQESYCLNFSAHISCWRIPPGRWDDLQSDLCSIVVTPGSIEAFSGTEPLKNARPSEQPLVALVLTPIVMIRQSNGLDVEIHSQPLETSLLKCSHIVRFRSRNEQECRALYAATHKARQDNEQYNRLQRERILNDYGKQSDKEWGERKARNNWFGRKKSYRASGRASSFSGSDKSAFSMGTAFLALKRISNGAGFNSGWLIPNISGLESGNKSRGSSLYGASDSAQSTSPRTTTDPSIATTGTTNTSVFDPNNLVIRLHRGGVSNRWIEMGLCRLTIGPPQPGKRQASSLYNGVLKHVTLTQYVDEKPTTILNKHFVTGNVQTDSRHPTVFFDGVLGARCFSRANRVGIVMNVWEEMVGPNGEVGMPGAVGGVSGKQRKWMFLCSNSTQAGWIFALLGGGV